MVLPDAGLSAECYFGRAMRSAALTTGKFNAAGGSAVSELFQQCTQDLIRSLRPLPSLFESLGTDSIAFPDQRRGAMGGTFVLFQQRFHDFIRSLQLFPGCLNPPGLFLKTRRSTFYCLSRWAPLQANHNPRSLRRTSRGNPLPTSGGATRERAGIPSHESI
jgi:hypothetical protein